MTMIFKYFSERIVDLVFDRDDHVGIKCSSPKEYNDPFELFLGVNLDQSAELLATYSEVVQEIPIHLTSCFSRSPVVSPMWAHYGNNHQGFVVGFDASALQEVFQDVLIRDISYLDGPSEDLVAIAKMAAYRKKPRDAAHLQNAVLYRSYFSKYTEWSYEQEVRAVNIEKYTEDVNGHHILYIPKNCVSSIISGKNASQATRQSLEEVALELNAKFYVEEIGRSYPKPYLIDDTGSPRIFSNGSITLADGVCGECSEPLRVKAELCPWCSIDEVDQMTAAENNPFRILSYHGLLEDYLENFPRNPRKPYK